MCLRKGFYDDGDHLSFFLVHYDFKIMFCDPPKFDFTIRWHVLMVGLENMLAILATVRWALSVRCTAFYRALTPAAEALLSRWWLKREQSSKNCKGNSQGRSFISTKEKANNHILEDADKMENSLAKLASSSLDFCACLYLELLGFIFLYMQREDPPEGCPLSPSIGNDSWTITTCFRKDNVGDPAQESRKHCVLV